MKKILYSILIGLIFLASGCSTAYYRSGNLIAVKQRFVGLSIAQNPTTQMYQLYFGYGSTVYQMVPTSTNHIYAPNYLDTFDLGVGSSWANPFNTSISEDTGTGDDVVFTGKASVLVSTNKSMPLKLTSPKEAEVNDGYRLGSRFQKQNK